ncbi:MAG: tripartite tricarboxylate transporter substrate binding protein [Zoogloeaceae bacterium]|nr:tripartite tricarboxylate transporter substrate binding protein [Zoogloeaceae bacterium]
MLPHTSLRLPRLMTSAALAFSAALFAPFAPAQDNVWPSRAIKLVVPFPPGGACDTIARIYGEKLSEAFGQAVIIENKPGAGTAIAAEYVARSAPDGYTLAVAPAGQLTLLPNLSNTPGYDPVKDFSPVSLLATVPYVIAAKTALPVSNLPELIARAKARPGQIAYSSCGAGTVCHLSGEQFKIQTGTNLLHVPYKGSSPAIAALLGGEVDLAFDTLAVLAPQIKAGKVKALAIASKARSPLLPDVPTAAESGLKDFEIESWFSVVAPSGTPPEVVRALNEALGKISRREDVQEKFTAAGIRVLHSTPEQLRRQIQEDLARWKKVIASSGAALE